MFSAFQREMIRKEPDGILYKARGAPESLIQKGILRASVCMSHLIPVNTFYDPVVYEGIKKTDKRIYPFNRSSFLQLFLSQYR